MDFDLSADQLALRDAAVALLAAGASPQRVRAVVDSGGGWDRDLWRQLVEQGWCALPVAEEQGGIGLGWVELAVVLEAVGQRAAPVPVLGQVLAADLLGELVAAAEPAATSGATSELADLLARVMAGDTVVAVTHRPVTATPTAAALGEGPAGGDTWRLEGSTEPAPFVPSAPVVLVVGDVGGPSAAEPHLFAVHVPEPPPPQPAMDLTREVARLDCSGLRAVHLGGTDLVEAYRARAAVAYCAEMLGCASTALAMAVEHAKEREQFGRPIGSFQAVKHRCADMLVDLEGMRSLTWWAAWCLSAGDPDAVLAASAAKAWCADAASRILDSALQVHGGIGFTWECDLHLHLKRVQLDRVAFGSAAEHRDRVAALLSARVRAGEPVFG